MDVKMKHLCLEADKMRDEATYGRYYRNNDGVRTDDNQETETSSESTLSESKADTRKLRKAGLWKVPDLPKLTYNFVHTSRYNALDDDTIYGLQREERDEVVFKTEVPMLPPLEGSPRFQQDVPDFQHVKEKQLVWKHNFRTGRRRHFECDRALVPSVYADFFECPKRTRSYVRAMYNEDYVRRDHENPSKSIDCTKVKYAPRENCQYCDVIGNRYCSFCIEFKNRHFAWGYENNFVAVRPHTPMKRNPRDTMIDPRYLTTLVGKSTVLSLNKRRRKLPPLPPRRPKPASVI